MDFIDLKAQYAALKPAMDARINAVLQHAQFIMGPEIGELEGQLAKRLGVAHAITCASGTDALLLSLMALGVGAGDEVITSPFTFVATAEVVALLGAKPVFVDVDRDTYNLDPQLLAPAITSRTKAIIPVALYGQCADMDVINAIAAQHGIAVIEDAAQSFGATYKGRSSGNLSTVGCTSFFPSKPLGCYGDGGACFTNDDALATRLRQLRNHGQDRRYHHPLIGINGRLDTLQAAVLLAKLESFDAELKARERVGARYTELLSATVRTPRVAPYNKCVYAQYTIEVSDREAVAARLNATGVPTAVHYPTPLNLQPAFASPHAPAGKFPHSEDAAARVLSLPMHPYLDEKTIAQVATAVCDAVCVRS